MYDLFIDPPVPLVPRHLRAGGVASACRPTAPCSRPLDEAQRARRDRRSSAPRASRRSRSACCTPTAIPAHERALARLCAELAPGVPVSCSSDVVPEIREYERTSTTIANVYVMPLMARYLDDLERKLHELGIPGRLLRHAVGRRHRDPRDRQARADPARGIGARRRGRSRRRAWRARSAGAALLSFDMGGTTAKACVIDGGEPLLAREFEVARADRFKKGSGLPIRVPVHRADRDRRGRRLHRARRPHGPAQGRAGQRGRRSGPGLLRAGRPRAHRHRRRPAAGLSRRRLLPGRPHAARRGGGAPRRRGARRAPAGPRRSPTRPGASIAWSTRTWRAPRACTASSAARTCAPIPSSPSAARGRCTPGRWGASCRVPRVLVPFGAGAHLGLRAPGRAARLRLRAHRAPAPGRGGLGADQPPLRGDGGRGPRASSAARAWPIGTSPCAAPPRCATWARATRWTSRCPAGPLGAGSLGGDHRRVRGRLPRALQPHPAGRAARGAQLARRRLGPAAEISRSRGRAWRAGAAATPAPKKHAHGLLPGGARLRRHARCTTATRSAPGVRLAGPGHRRGARVHHRHRPGRA